MSNKYFSEEFIKIYNDFYKQVINSSQLSSEQLREAMKPYVTLADSIYSYKAIYKIGLEPLNMLKDILISQKISFQGTYELIDTYKTSLTQYSFASDAYKSMIRDLQKYANNLNEVKEEPSTFDAGNLAVDLQGVPLEDLTYTIDESDQVEYSPPLENIVDGIVESVYDDASRPSKDKVHNKDFFLTVLLPLILAVLSIVFDISSDIQTTKQLEQQHQEEIAIQEQLLQEEQRQTEYLKELSETSSNQSPQE